MSKAQEWTMIFLGFILILAVILGMTTCGIATYARDLLESPASTSKFSINGEFYTEITNDDGVPVKLRIDSIEGEINSKILDLIIIAIGD